MEMTYAYPAQTRSAPGRTSACHNCHNTARRAAAKKVPKTPLKQLRGQRAGPQPQLWAVRETSEDGASQGTSNEPRSSTDRSNNFQDAETPGEEGVQTALKALRWYKGKVSPYLPRSCRFLPTCSEYSMQAYKEFGNVKGTVLTAWRLMRCNPLNWRVKYQGKYDPPKWPPVGFEWLSSAE